MRRDSGFPVVLLQKIFYVYGPEKLMGWVLLGVALLFLDRFNLSAVSSSILRLAFSFVSFSVFVCPIEPDGVFFCFWSFCVFGGFFFSFFYFVLLFFLFFFFFLIFAFYSLFLYPFVLFSFFFFFSS